MSENIDIRECDCPSEAEINAQAHLVHTKAFGACAIIAVLFAGLTVIGFVGFLLLAAWYDHKIVLDSAVTATVFGTWSLIITACFGMACRLEIQRTIKMLKGEHTTDNNTKLIQ